MFSLFTVSVDIVHSFSVFIITMQLARMVEMMAVEKRGWVSTEIAMRRMGLKGERRKRPLVAENLVMSPDLVRTMNVLLSA